MSIIPINQSSNPNNQPNNPINQPNKPEYGTTLTEADYEQAVTMLQLAERDMRQRAWGSAHFTLLHAMLNLQIKPMEGDMK